MTVDDLSVPLRLLNDINDTLDEPDKLTTVVNPPLPSDGVSTDTITPYVSSESIAVIIDAIMKLDPDVHPGAFDVIRDFLMDSPFSPSARPIMVMLAIDEGGEGLAETDLDPDTKQRRLRALSVFAQYLYDSMREEDRGSPIDEEYGSTYFVGMFILAMDIHHEVLVDLLWGENQEEILDLYPRHTLGFLMASTARIGRLDIASQFISTMNDTDTLQKAMNDIDDADFGIDPSIEGYEEVKAMIQARMEEVVG